MSALDVIKAALDQHQQDAWVEQMPHGHMLMRGDCSDTGEDGYEAHDEPFTMHQARFVLGALEMAGLLFKPYVYTCTICWFNEKPRLEHPDCGCCKQGHPGGHDGGDEAQKKP